MHKKILMVYIEPTPYIIGLIQELQRARPGEIDVLFLEENHSQQWNIQLDKQWKMWPTYFSQRIRLTKAIFFQKKYPIIHLAGWARPLLLLFILLAKLTGVLVSVESDTPIPQKISFKKRLIKRLIYPALFRLIHAFIPGGTRQAKYFEYYGVNSSKIFPARMTVDVTHIQKFIANLNAKNLLHIRQLNQLAETDVVFLFVGRLLPHKGILDLLDAFERLSAKQVKLLIVGDGPLRKWVENKVQQNNKIHYAGRLTQEKLLEIYYAANVVVVPSHFEPWGLVVNEAMAVGRPVIAADCVGCIDDLIHHQKNGWIFQTGSVDQLRQAMEYFIEQSKHRLAMEVESAKIIADWTLENEAKNICHAWNQIT
jgi:glycosyltransferase involved in cell wall biosynthesis